MFRQEVGLSPSAYQLQLHINRAKSLLGQQMAIADVAAQLGFCHQNHLTRGFKRLVSVTPRQYQQDCAGEIQSPSGPERNIVLDLAAAQFIN